MALAHIFYNSALLQSILSMQIARIHAEKQGYTTTLTDVTGKNQSQLLSAITDISVNTMTAVYVCSTTQATYSAAGLFTNDHLAEIDNLLVTASKGTTITSGTLQSNATVTEAILAAATASAVDDTYNGYNIRTAGTTAKNRYITDYVGTTKTVTIVSTSTALTTTETYVIFSRSSKQYVIGNAASNETACRVAWRTLFPTKQFPVIVNMLGGYGTIATGLNGVTDGVTTFKQAYEVTQTATSANTTSLTHTSHFAAVDCYKNKWVGIESGTLGVGQVRQITSNTVSALTVPLWTAPTGTIVYTVAESEWQCMAHKYLTLAIPTYLYATDSDTLAIWKKLIDKYSTLYKSTVPLVGDIELLKTYIARGKCIFDAQVKGVVT